MPIISNSHPVCPRIQWTAMEKWVYVKQTVFCMVGSPLPIGHNWSLGCGFRPVSYQFQTPRRDMFGMQVCRLVCFPDSIRTPQPECRIHLLFVTIPPLISLVLDADGWGCSWCWTIQSLRQESSLIGAWAHTGRKSLQASFRFISDTFQTYFRFISELSAGSTLGEFNVPALAETPQVLWQFRKESGLYCQNAGFVSFLVTILI